jgi:hypothetical protein
MLESTAPYSQSRVLQSEKEKKELPNDYEKRVWRERMWVTENGHVFIPPMQFCNSLKEAAKYLSIPVPGKGGKVTFTKNFEAGVLVTQRLVLPDITEKVLPEKLYVPSDGRRDLRDFRRPDYRGDIPAGAGCFRQVNRHRALPSSQYGLLWHIQIYRFALE